MGALFSRALMGTEIMVCSEVGGEGRWHQVGTKGILTRGILLMSVAL